MSIPCLISFLLTTLVKDFKSQTSAFEAPSPCAGCWIRRKQKRRHGAEKAELLKRMEEETLRAKYAANGALLTAIRSHLYNADNSQSC